MNQNLDHHCGHVVAGIAGFGTYVPSNRISAQELAQQANIPVERLTEGIGFTHIHKANDDEHPFTMGLAAAKDALLDAGIKGEDLDLVIFVSAGDYDYRFWCPSSAIVRELGCHHAYSFEVKNGCAGGNLACNIAIGLMDRDSSVKTALVICADTLTRVVNPEIVECQPLLYFGDGAAAVVLKRNHPRYQLLSFAEHTDGDLGDLLRIEAGGTRMPINADFKDWTKTYSKVDASAFAQLIDQVYLKEYLAVIKKALERSGHSISEMEYILMNQVKNSLRTHILEGIGMPQSHTYISMGEFGHIGPADCFFTMAKAHREGLLNEGKLAILAASGLGFSWAATIIRC
jgi:3-oxoacyl-[acyl-carrier-protein] synthase-3